MKAAVLVIDMLEDFFKEPPLKNKRAPLCKNINELIDTSREYGTPVIWVRQEFKNDLSDAFLIMRKNNIRITMKGTKGARILGELHTKRNDKTIVKKRYSAFFGTGLHRHLQQERINALILAGINTHACVRVAAIDAYQRDYEVIIAKDCVSSPYKGHHRITLQYLEAAMGIPILTNEEVFEILST